MKLNRIRGAALWRLLLPALWLAVLDVPPAKAQARTLPVWIEESHAGSFHFLAQVLPLNVPHTLVLFDAHSDASAIAKSDSIREAIRKVASLEERAAKLHRWREQGAIQAFNWLEPLMPLPVEEVIWVPMRKLDEAARARMEQEAREYLDAHEEGLPREAGPLAGRFRVMDFEAWRKDSATWPRHRRVVASIDLDYFAPLPDEVIPREVSEVVDSVLSLRGLEALCWALSTPWLKSQEQADLLLRTALDESWRIANAEVRWEPLATAGPDRSMLAKLRERKGEQTPRYDLARASLDTRTLILQRWRPEHTQVERERMEALMREWRRDAFLPRLRLPDRAAEADGSYRLQAGESASVIMEPPPTGAKVRWWALRAGSEKYRITDADFGFASEAPGWMQDKPVLLAEGPVLGSLPLEKLRPVLDPGRHCGTVRIFAEVIRDGEGRRTPLLTLRVRATGSSGLRAAWSEQFALPYVFGSTWLQADGRTGPETGWGADCANFIIAGYRSEGWRVPWGSPRDLRPRLVPWEGPVKAEEGCLIHFGSHLAALWEDREPRGVLDDADLVVHHLEGYPAILSYGELKKGRRTPEILRLRRPARGVRVLFGGDVMLGRRVGAGVRAGRNPMAALQGLVQAADLAVVNFEGAVLPSGMGADAKAPLAAPHEAIPLLAALGIDAVTLANNHTLDRGPDGLRHTMVTLDAAGIRHAGAGRNPREALKPLVLEVKGRKLAFISLFDDDSPPSSVPCIATTASPDDVAASIRTARERENADVVVLLPHWGVEHTRVPTGAQRALAAQWVETGADLIVGAGPHVVQPLEHGLGASVAWSLGNLVFDGPGPTPDWSRGALLEVTWDADTMKMVRARMIPVRVADDGTVEFVE